MLAALTVAVVLLLVGVAVVVRATARGPAFVTRSGQTLQLDGKPFRFVGFDLYDAAATDRYSCSPGTRLSAAGLDRAMQVVRDAGGTVVRFWAYQTYTDGGRDWTGVDQVLRAARDHGIHVLPVLEDGPGNCTTGPDGVAKSQVDGDGWYAGGYKRPFLAARLSYRDYARVVAEHYRDDPTILGWSMMNEAETTRRSDAGVSTIVGFARDVAGVLHQADPHHLVTVGTQGNGAPGASGADFAAIYGLSGVDFTEVHDWAHYGSDTQAMPGANPDGSLPDPSSPQCTDTAAKIACSFAIARTLDKPIVVGEAGIRATDDYGRRRRARLLGDKMSAAFRDGAAGYLVWQLNTDPTDGYDVLLGSDDPLYATMRRQAANLH